MSVPPKNAIIPSLKKIRSNILRIMEIDFSWKTANRYISWEKFIQIKTLQINFENKLNRTKDGHAAIRLALRDRL